MTSRTNTTSSSIGQSKLDNDWVADFETTTDPADCRVWGWGRVSLADPQGPVDIGNSIQSFINHVSSDSGAVYFHNLAFDGRFILDWLLKNEYRHTTGKKTPPGTFKTLISKQGKFYSITVGWFNGKRTDFRDSMKKLPMSVSRIADAFRADMAKGEIDYNAPRPVGHEVTNAERAYIESDVRIVAQALRQQLIAGMTKLTVGADSLAEFKRLMGQGFDRLFPVLNDTMDAEIRRAYRGGWTYADPRFRGRVIHHTIRVYDVNSLYPSVMYDRLLPYGNPVWFEDGEPPTDGEYPLYIAGITFTAKLKPSHVPCIQIKLSPFFSPNTYQEEIVEPITLMCTNVDLALWREHYDLDILAWEGAWCFRGMEGIFQPYIDKWMEVKRTASGGIREIAKLHLNSLYGKFATNPDVTGKIPELNNDQVDLITGDEETRDPVYTPMGVFITAYARDVTIRAAQANYARFAYADTDSLHLLTDTDPDLTIDPDALGAWKFEGEYKAGIYVRAKCYAEQKHDGSYDVHIAGLPDMIARRLTFDDFWQGNEFGGKLTPHVVPGGVVLLPTTWKLSDEFLLTHRPSPCKLDTSSTTEVGHHF